ncbi:MAG: ABC transporter permease [Rhodospirillales bacterium]|nr:ABC transporter permease [Rhodospirillales bacterium]
MRQVGGSASVEVTQPRLKARLRRAERTRVLRALALVLPLGVFLLLVFFAPIGDMLFRSVHDPEMATTLPETAAALREWDGIGAPPAPVTAALIRELPQTFSERKLAGVAQRLNHDISGFRSLILSTGRQLDATPESPDAGPADPAARLAAIDERWEDHAYWAALRRASFNFTDFYLLAALDLRRDSADRITAVAPEEAIFVTILGRTIEIAATVTVLCLLLGYPLAYVIATAPGGTSNLLMILVLLPFWTSLLVRTSAWVVLLQNEGVINGLLLASGLVDKPMQLIFNRFGVYVAMTHVLLPFMILPLYSVMQTINPATMRAAASLGAPPPIAFLRVYLPQSLPGIGAGGLLVFILAIGYYITPALVGGANDQMISYFIAFYTTRTVNWGLAAALATLLLAATGVLYSVYVRIAGTAGVRLG